VIAYKITLEDLLVKTELHFGHNHAKLLQGYENLVRTMNMLFGDGDKKKETVLENMDQAMGFFAGMGIPMVGA
jgi:hypothetical protein